MSEPFGSETYGPKTCYHIFFVLLIVHNPPGGGWTLYDSTGGYTTYNIRKTCQCMSAWEVAGFKLKFGKSGIKSSPSQGSTPGTVFAGYEIEEKGKCPPKRCRCDETINLAGMSSKDGSWTDSTGTQHPFTSTNSADVIKDIIDTERGLPCDCS